MTGGSTKSPSHRAPSFMAAGPVDGGSFEYRLQRTPVGVVVLDAARKIRAANPLARHLLARDESTPLFGVDILSLHPEGARAKVGWLIDCARDSADGVASLLVTTPMGSLVAKVTRLHTGPAPANIGYCMMFHAQGEIQMGENPEDGLGPLLKLPLMRGKGGVTTLIEVDQVACLTAQGHYAEAKTLSFTAFCPRSLADLERRLDPTTFVRVHRRHLVNIRHVLAAERDHGRLHLRLADPDATLIPVSRDKVDLMRRLLAV
ncbi:LytTR family DNA-binding domain-containing protein [Magnetospirillum molischianum]|uniref:Putative response regulator n=1 Tax=Magnetospirillum molischianum DSM 120 TaxID=1150626 RepID=H8FV29_MAGML|nr:LytTR family DNA-binding domain-containing protein [Magnetospirillum molischianum]CCG42217.1 putative response regulator [Magnetospirillum molischianum DSM 120]